MLTGESALQATRLIEASLIISLAPEGHTRTAEDCALINHVTCRCPGCQAFQPTYEKIALFFNAEPRPQPEVVVARIDCAEEVRTLVRKDHCKDLYFKSRPSSFQADAS